MSTKTTSHNDCAECPHCGYYDSAPYCTGVDEDEPLTVECDRCGYEYVLSLTITRTYEATADVKTQEVPK